MINHKLTVLIVGIIFWSINLSAQKIDLSYIDTIPTTKEKILKLASMMESLIYTSPQQANEVTEKVLELASNSTDENVKGISLNVEGMNLFCQKKYEASVLKYIEAIKYFERVDSSRYVAKLNNNIAASYTTSGDLEGGLLYYQKSLSFYQQEKDTIWMANMLNNMAINYMNLKKYKESEQAYDEAIKYFQGKGLDFYVGIGHLNIGNLNVETKKYAKAITQYDLAMKLVSPDQNKLVHAAGLGGKGLALLNLNQLNEAEDNLKKSLVYAKELNHHEQMKVSLEGLAQVYEKEGNYKEALETYKLYSIVKDTFFQQTQNQSLVDAVEKYEAAEKEAKIIELNAQNEIAHLRLSNSRKLLWASLIGLLIFTGLAYYLFSLNKTIKRQNAIISKSLNEKDFLLREIHHRVKNNMQFISSLLSLQSDYVTDPTAKKALHTGEHRVQSMALIHQNLYQEDNLTGIETATYFKKLAKNLFDAYNINEETINLHLDVEEVILDVDTMVPLGLIVNELISNSLKHGFPEKRKGNIYVSLKNTDAGTLTLHVKDDGVGLGEDELKKLNQSFGFRLIEAFTDQLNAQYSGKYQDGFDIRIDIKDFKKIAA
ncbi:MAG TPA: histidine kinase dimerization/phosphoacceptor domain -containing protein [Saprospiraceae bacterium]|nr:histidine kinase dimerization/phosphoacceptor domain -containing protein [Saprospiraceae bacterium]